MYKNENYSGAKQLVYISNISGWNYTNSCLIKNSRSNLNRSIYTFDVWNLNQDSLGYDIWNPLWLNRYTDSSGENIYSNLENIHPLTKLAQSNANEQVFRVDFDFSPLVPETSEFDFQPNYNFPFGIPYESETTTWQAESLMYELVVRPAYPILIANTIVDDRKYMGPIFLSSAKFSCGQGQSVDITAQFQGSKYFYNSGDIVESSLDESKYQTKYRSANFIDCACILSGSESFDRSNNRVIEISLSIEQSFNFDFPCHTDDVDDLGARFIGLNNRIVRGYITILSKEPTLNIKEFNTLDLYFGGPFYFPMDNIRWQDPTLNIETENGWFQRFNFIALASENSKISSSGIGILSEFNINME